MDKWTVGENVTLTKKDLQENHVYLLPFLSKNGSILINHCLYALINGQVVIHRSANWEDIPTSDLTKSAFLHVKDETIEEIPDELICFVDLNKELDLSNS